MYHSAAQANYRPVYRAQNNSNRMSNNRGFTSQNNTSSYHPYGENQQRTMSSVAALNAAIQNLTISYENKISILSDDKNYLRLNLSSAQDKVMKLREENRNLVNGSASNNLMIGRLKNQIHQLNQDVAGLLHVVRTNTQQFESRCASLTETNSILNKEKQRLKNQCKTLNNEHRCLATIVNQQGGLPPFWADISGIYFHRQLKHTSRVFLVQNNIRVTIENREIRVNGENIQTILRDAEFMFEVEHEQVYYDNKLIFPIPCVN